MRSLRYNKETDTWQCFTNPVIVKKAFSYGEVTNITKEIETICHEKSLFALLLLHYEAAPAFDSLLTVKNTKQVLASIAYYETYEELTPESFYALGQKKYCMSPVNFMTEDEYEKSFYAIKAQIKSGNTYQINYTFPFTSFFDGCLLSWFIDAVRRNPSPYAFYHEDENTAVCSFSPELFFTRQRKETHYELVFKPMKGTIKRREGYEAEDARTLSQSPKNRAENLMITDMVRNDVSKTALTGTVTVPRLYETEIYTSVIQMTSTIHAVSDASLYDTLCAVYPCASITGAPKIQSMKIINELEKTERGVYTGAIGYVDKNGNAVFSIPIRTAFLSKESNLLTYGVGSGIVWDSQSNDEYEECRNKASVLKAENDSSFYVFDSMLLEEGVLFLLDKHRKRLEKAVSFFYNKNPDSLRDLFEAIERHLISLSQKHPEGSYKIRTSITKDLVHTVTSEVISTAEHTLKLAVMKDTVYTKTPFFTFKTSYRNAYSGIKNQYPYADDVLLINENGEATETTRGNILIQTPEGLFTPCESSGLLAGTYREFLLESGQCTEKILYEKDIREAQQVWMINSVRRKVLCTIL